MNVTPTGLEGAYALLIGAATWPQEGSPSLTVEGFR